MKESNDDVKVVTDLMNKLKLPSSYVKRSTRLGRKGTLPESHSRPVLLKFYSTVNI